jgi:hypothetical protein
LLKRFLAFLSIAALAACSNTPTGTTITPITPPTQAPPAISVKVQGALTEIGDVIKVTAKQSSYAGPFTYTSTDASVLGLSLTDPAGLSARARRALAKQRIISPDGVAFVIAAGAGTASVSVRGDNRTAHPAALNDIVIGTPGAITVTPAELTFSAVGPANAQTARVVQAGYAGSFTESDDCTGIATIQAETGAGATYRVTAARAGSCEATFTGGGSLRGVLPISVALPGGVVLSPASLSFTATGSANAKTVTATQANYTGAFSEKDTCAKIATVAAASNADGKATYSVTPVGAGSCVAAVTGGGNLSNTLPISVVLPGVVVVSPTSLEFTATGSVNSKTATVTQANFNGRFVESDTCAKIANLVATSNAGGKASYTVTPLGAGSCSATFAGGDKASNDLPISVTLPGGVVVVPNSLSFTATGSSHAKSVAVSQSRYTGTFAQSDTCAGIALLAPTSNTGGKAAYTVTPVGAGTCAATFTGGDKQHATLPISVVLPGPVVLAPPALSFTTSGVANAKTVRASQSNYSGSFSTSDTCANVATVTASSNGGGAASYRVTAVGSGSCRVTVTGGNQRSAVLPVSVKLPGPVLLRPASLEFIATGASNVQTVHVSQSGYASAFTESSTCAAIATITSSSNANGQATYVVTPVAAGSCRATFTGGNDVAAALPISVVLPGPVVLSPTGMTFKATGSSNAQTLAVSQGGYNGTFAETNDCAATATVSVTSNAAGHASYKVTAHAGGSCTAVFTGGNKQSKALPISVILPGGVQASPAPLNFLAIGPGQAVTETVTQSGFGGTYSESDTCAGFATFAVASNAHGTAHYTVTPVGSGICQAVFTGGNAQSFTLHVTVTQTGFGIQIRRPGSSNGGAR